MVRFGKREPKPKGPRGELLPQENEGLPDSQRPSGLCPRCGKQSSFEIKGHLPVTFDYEMTAVTLGGVATESPIDRVTSLICRHCEQGVAVIEEKRVGDEPGSQQRSGGANCYRGIHWWPLPDAKLSPDIPNEIAGAFAEAVRTLAANCPRASAVMARRTLEAITVDQGETKGGLADRLHALGVKGVLHPILAEWAKEVRLAGNVGAHFDPIEQVTPEDAQQLLNFIRELLKYLYELPAELNRRRSPMP
jgi:hypothetical protein